MFEIILKIIFIVLIIKMTILFIILANHKNELWNELLKRIN